ncbi:MAG: cobalamin-dependent protein [Desulfobacteraceae bacterium]|nr:cobalamin-dependent protein [Desulfobacteraceae bacterium]
MANILLIHPYGSPEKSFSIVPSLGLGYIASALIAKGHHVDIVDCLHKGIKPPILLKIIKDSKPDLIGITIFSLFFYEAKETIDAIKKELDIPIVVGGPHVSALPELTMRESKADFAVIGEGEVTIAELVDVLFSGNKDFSKVKGIGYKKNGEIKINGRRDLVKDLDAIPFPAWGEIRPEGYPPFPHGTFYKRFPFAPIMTTRGCPYECSFCASSVTWEKSLRKRSPKKIVDEMEFLVKNHGIREFHFEDDNLTVSKEHVMGVCHEILDRKLDIVWSCPNGVRLDCLDRERIDLMKASGCYMLAIGFESGDQGILDRAQKKLDLTRVFETVKMIKNAGIDIMGFFIIGLPLETKETARKTIEFAKKMPIDYAKFHNFVPLPGTPLFREWFNNQNGQIEWGKSKLFGDAVFDTSSLSSKELTKLQKRAHLEFYSRPSIFIRTLLKIKPRQLKWIASRFFNMFIH